MMRVKVEEWRQESHEGRLCGILGCTKTPTYKCPRCGHHYCEEHKTMHFDVIDTANAVKKS